MHLSSAALVLGLLLAPALTAQEAPDMGPAARPAKPAARAEAPAAAAASDASPSVSSLGLKFDALKDAGKRSFEYRMDDDGTWKTLGTWTMTTEVKDDRITMADHVELSWRGAPFVVDVTVSGPLSGCLRPDSIVAGGTTDDGDGKTFEAKATLDATTMHAGKRETPVPAETVTDSGLFRLLTLLPARDGFRAHVDGLIDASELNVKGGSVIRYDGRSKPPAGKDGDALESFSVLRTEDVGRHAESAEAWLQVWRDDKGHLVQVLLDGRKLLVAVP